MSDVAVPPVRLTVTVVAVGRAAPSSCAVTSTTVGTAFSWTLSGDSIRSNLVEGTSSSVRSSVAPVTRSVPAVAVTSSVSVPSVVSSFSTVRVNGPEVLLLPAGIVIVNGFTSTKSSPTVAEPLPTVTVTSVEEVPALSFSAAVTVTVVFPASSRTLSGFTLNITRVDGSSLSDSSSVAGVTARVPADPSTVRVSSPSATSSSSGVSPNVPVPLVLPASIVTTTGSTEEKSVPSVAVSPDTVTFTSVAAVPAFPFRVAVTVTDVAPAPSPTLVGLTLNDNDSAAKSLSVSSKEVGFTVSPPASVPLTVSVSGPSATSSSSGVRLNVPEPLVLPASILTMNGFTREKSFPTVAVSPATVTLTDVADVLALLSKVAVTVTVVEPAPSATLAGFTLSVTAVDGSSLSVSSRVADVTGRFAVPATVRVSTSSATSSSTGVSVNVPVPLGLPTPIVTVNASTAA